MSATKFCPKCSQRKSREEFNESIRAKDGLQYLCRDCQHARWADIPPEKMKRYQERSKKYNRSRYKTDEQYRKKVLADRAQYRAKVGKGKLREQHDRWRLRFFYGLDRETVEAMRKEQNDCCALCGRKRKLHIDHDHTTGAVRGLLCRPCNTALGQLGDTVQGLMRAVRYLRKHAKRQQEGHLELWPDEPET